MIIAGVVAAVVLAIGLLATGLPLRRPAPGRAESVAVLLVAGERAGLDAAVAAARELAPAVFVVADGVSFDDPVETPDVPVVTTLRPLGLTAAAATGLRAFDLVSGFRFVLVLDAMTRVPPGHLANAVTRFADGTVGAVDATVDAPGVLGGYWARTAPAGFGRLYRTEVLAATDGELGTSRVTAAPGPPAVAAAPSGAGRFGAVRAHAGWYRSAVGAALGQPRGLARWLDLVLGVGVLGLMVSAVLIGPSVGGYRTALWVLAGFVVGDLLRTALTRPRRLLAGLAFPLVRLADAVVLLRGWVVVLAVGLAAVGRVAVTAGTLPAAAVERVLTDVGYGRFAGVDVPRPGGALVVTDAQFAVFTALTGSLRRHADVLTGTRELAVVAVAVLLAGIVVVAVSLRVRPPAVVVAVLVVLAAAPVFTQLGPGVVAAAWLAVAMAAILFAARRKFTRRYLALVVIGLVGTVAVVAALATLPLLVIPLAVGVATWLWFLDIERYDPDATWRGEAIVLIFLVGCAVAALWRADLLLAPTGPAVADRSVVLVAVTVVAVVGIAAPKAWPVVTATLTGVGLLGWLGPAADALLPVLVAGVAVIVALVLATVRPPLLATGFAAVLATAAAATVLVVPPAAPLVGHAALADWVAREVPGEARVAVPADVWADLHRDFARRGRDTVVVGTAGSLVATTGPHAGVVLARFGTLTLLATELDPSYLDRRDRAAAGRQLADNPRLHAPDGVLAALRDGRVDQRAMAVLAGLCVEHDLTVAATGNDAAERGTALPNRTVTLSELDGRPLTRATAVPLLDWLDAQLPPYAPAARTVTGSGVALSWQLPELLVGATR